MHESCVAFEMEEAKETKRLESKAVAPDMKKTEATETKQLESEADAPDKKRKKKRCIVDWTPKEDEILREQIEILGTESWTAIASKFKGKTSRQCRSRWFFCLNTDLKTGSWSPEEDMLLCKAQKKYGNRWTEIAKVIKGRTDNAVKNRFKALCVKRQALAEENSTSDINESSKRSISNDDGSRRKDVEAKSKRMRVAKRPAPLKKCNNGNASDKDSVNEKMQQQRPPLAESSQNNQKSDAPETSTDGDRKTEGCSNMDNASNDFPDLQGFLHKDKHIDEESRPFEEDFDIHSFTDLLMDLRNDLSNTMEDQPDLHDSPRGRTTSMETCTFHHNDATRLQKIDTTDQEEISALCHEPKNEDLSTILPANVISSPLQLTPLFKTLAATIPTPQFSASERHFLMKTLGIESPSLEKTTNHSQPPSCRRSLVHSL